MYDLVLNRPSMECSRSVHQDAGVTADLKDLRVISEPTTAAIGYLEYLLGVMQMFIGINKMDCDT